MNKQNSHITYLEMENVIHNLTKADITYTGFKYNNNNVQDTHTYTHMHVCMHHAHTQSRMRAHTQTRTHTHGLSTAGQAHCQ